MRKRRSARIRFVRPSWNARRSICEKCGTVEEQPERLLVRLNLCTTCIEEGHRDHVKHYRKTRFWAVYEDDELLCVTVYKKGANAVKTWLDGTQVPAVRTEERQATSLLN
jgi:hypothetical protein